MLGACRWGWGWGWGWGRGCAPGVWTSVSRPPNAASVVFGARDDKIAFVVEGTAKDLVRVPLEHLRAGACLRVPQPRGLIAAGRDHAGGLRVEAHPGDLSLVALQHVHALARAGAVDACCLVRARA